MNELHVRVASCPEETEKSYLLEPAQDEEGRRNRRTVEEARSARPTLPHACVHSRRRDRHLPSLPFRPDVLESVCVPGHAPPSLDAVGRGASSTGWAWGATFFDFDNDGDDDLYCVNGMNEYAVYSSHNPYYTDAAGKSRDVLMPVAARESNVLFVNSGGRLVNRSVDSGADLLGNSRSVSYLDHDADGDLDMILNNFQSPAVLYRNEADGTRHWLSVRLEGDPTLGSTRDAIGASIQVESARNPPQWREIHSTRGYLTSPPKAQYFGLGDATRADLLVRWPNGDKSCFSGLASDRRYRIVQGKEMAQAAPD